MYTGAPGPENPRVAAPHEAVAPDFSLPALDLGLVARRAALPLALAVVAVAVVLLAGGPLHVLADARRRGSSCAPAPRSRSVAPPRRGCSRPRVPAAPRSRCGRSTRPAWAPSAPAACC